LVISRTSEKSPTIYIHKTTTEQERDHSHINHLTVDGSFSSKKNDLVVYLLIFYEEIHLMYRKWIGVCVCERERKE